MLKNPDVLLGGAHGVFNGDRPSLSSMSGGNMSKQKKSYKVGRDANTGRFIPVKDAERRKKTAVVETIKRK